MGFYFLYPKFLLLLALVPLFILIYFSSFYYKKKKAINFPNFDAMQRVFGVEIFSRNFLSLFISIMILVSLVFASSGLVISYSGRGSVVIAVDNSQSMLTADIIPNRLEAAKISSQDFVSSLPPSTQISVAKFSGKVSVVQQPDTSKIKSKMVLSDLGYEAGVGTDFDELLYTANLLTSGAQKKFLVVITDGQFNSGNVNDSIKYAKENGIIVNSIAVGTETGGLTEAGTISKIDELYLQYLAFQTGGQYSRAEDLGAFERSFKEMVSEAKSDVTFDMSTYLIFFALLLFSGNWILHNFRFRTIP
jgi:Ca-activated chloride channel family protein